jgi:hypothetical protein
MDANMKTVRGSCLCGGVKFEITGPLSNPLNCHCSQCRKQHGAAFRSRIRVLQSDFRWIQGEELVQFYESSPDFRRGFCSRCGSPILNQPGPNSRNARIHQQAAPELGIPLAILDGEPPVRPQCHVFVGSKAPWYEITDDLPQYEEYAPSS